MSYTCRSDEFVSVVLYCLANSCEVSHQAYLCVRFLDQTNYIMVGECTGSNIL